MKYIKNKIKLSSIILLSIFLSACVQDNLDPDNYPEVGEVEDLTPPEAAFSFEQNIVDFTIYQLVNESVSATGQIWSIPADAVLVDESATLTDENIEVKFSGEGEFSVGLIATDDRPTFSEELVKIIEVAEPLEPIIPTPVILSPGFEDDDGVDSRNYWGRNSSANTINRVSGLNIFGRSTGSRVRSGALSAKFEDGGSLRQAYQAIEVTPNVNYRLSVWIKIGDNNTGLPLTDGDQFRLAVLNQTFDTYDLATFEAAILESVTADPGDEFARVSLVFNSEDLEIVAIYMDSKGVAEVQVDDISIEVL